MTNFSYLYALKTAADFQLDMSKVNGTKPKCTMPGKIPHENAYRHTIAPYSARGLIHVALTY